MLLKIFEAYVEHALALAYLLEDRVVRAGAEPRTVPKICQIGVCTLLG